MNKEQIKSFIKQIPKKIWQGLKTVYAQPHSKKYLLLSLFLIMIFLFLTFPYDLLILKKIYDQEGRSFKSIDLPVFEFSIIGDTVIKNPIIMLNNGNEITCKEATISTPNPISFLLNNKIESNFTLTLLKYALKDSEVIIDLNGGRVELSLDKQTNMPTNGSFKTEAINIVMKSFSIPISTQMGLVSLKKDLRIITSKEGIECIISNGTLRIDKFELTGDIIAKISGSIGLVNKKFDLTIVIDADTKELDPYRDLLTKYIINDSLTIKIGGTIDKPEPSIIEKGKNEN